MLHNGQEFREKRGCWSVLEGLMGLSQLDDVIDDDQLKQILECRPTEKEKKLL
jgi:hypothetical protein